MASSVYHVHCPPSSLLASSWLYSIRASLLWEKAAPSLNSRCSNFRSSKSNSPILYPTQETLTMRLGPDDLRRSRRRCVSRNGPRQNKRKHIIYFTSVVSWTFRSCNPRTWRVITRDGVNSIWPIPIPNPIPLTNSNYNSTQLIFEQFQVQFQLILSNSKSNSN